MGATAFTHISDLHFGLSAAVERAAERLCEVLLHEHPGPVLLTGDVTHRGKSVELSRFRDVFLPLLRAGRIISVPGNHDRLGDDLREALMPGPRVQAVASGGLFVVRLDSTGPHNRRWLDGHGVLVQADLDAVEDALRRAPAGSQSILMLHHHLLPVPDDHPMERLAAMFGWKGSREVRTGSQLLQRIRGLCDLVLHGHRHAPAERRPWPSDVRPLRIFNAGSSTLQRAFRTFRSARDEPLHVVLESATAAGPAPVPA